MDLSHQRLRCMAFAGQGVHPALCAGYPRPRGVKPARIRELKDTKNGKRRLNMHVADRSSIDYRSCTRLRPSCHDITEADYTLHLWHTE